MMRVAMISFHTCPLSSEEGKETGGMNVYVLELCKALVKSGYIVDVYTRDQDDSRDKVVEVEKNFHVIHLEAGPKKNISKKNLTPYLQEFTNSYFTYTKKHNLSYDVLHCHYYLSGLIGLLIQKKSPLPLVMSFHTLALMKNLVARTESEKESTQRIASEMELVKKSQAVISPSLADAHYLQYLYQCPKSKIVVIPPGVNKEIYYPIDTKVAKQKIGIDPKTKLVMFVGRIEPLKGIDILLYATKILTEKYPNLPLCILIIGGDTSQKKELWSIELQKLAEVRHVLGLKPTVTFLGRRKPEELPTYYNAADVVVMPSHYESFGMSALEAMSCGTPVITTDVAGITNFTNEKHKHLLITTSNNPLLLSTKIYPFLTNKKLSDEVSEELVEGTKQYDWKVIAQKVFRVYKKFRYYE